MTKQISVSAEYMNLIAEGVVTWIAMRATDDVKQGDYIYFSCINTTHTEMVRVLEVRVFDTLFEAVRHRRGPRLKNMLVNYTKRVDAARYLTERLGNGPYMFVNIVRKCWLDEINQ